MTLKIAALAPMPIARVRTATLVNPGIRARLRRTWFRRMTIDTDRTGQGSALRFCSTVAADVDLAGDDGALGNDEAWRADIARDGAGRVQVDPLRGRDISCHRTADHDGTGDEVRLDRRGGVDDQSVI